MPYEKKDDKTRVRGPIKAIDDTLETAILSNKEYHLSPIPALPVLTKNPNDSYLEQKIHVSVNNFSEPLKAEYIEFFKQVDILKSCIQNVKASYEVKEDTTVKEQKKGKRKRR